MATDQPVLERNDETEQRISRLEDAVTTLADAARRGHEDLLRSQQRTDERFAELAEAQRGTEERLDRLTAGVADLAARVGEIAKGLDRLTARVNDIADRLDRLTARVDDIAERLDRLTARVDDIAERLDRLTARVNDIADRLDRLTARVEDLTERLDRLTARVDDIAERLDRLTARVDDIAERLDRLTVRVDELTRIVEQLVRSQQDMNERISRNTNSLAQIRGQLLEMKYRDRAGVFFGRWLRRPEVVDWGELREILETHLGEDDVEEALRVDLVVKGQTREEGRDEELWLAVEVSGVVDKTDVKRAKERARLMRRARLRAVPVAAGESATQGALETATAEHVALLKDGARFLWKEALTDLREEPS